MFASVSVSCETTNCPEYQVEKWVAAQLDDHECLPQIVCGVCSNDITEEPHPAVEEPA